MVIKVFSTASSLQLGLFLSLPATAVILVALMVACLWRRTSPSSLTRTHSLVNIHQPHLPSRSNLLCPPSSQKKMGRYSMISLPMEIPDLVSSAALQNLMEGSSSLPRYTSSPHVGVQQQHCPVLPGARNLPPSSSAAHGVSPIPRTVAGLHRQSIHSLPGSQLISNMFSKQSCNNFPQTLNAAQLQCSAVPVLPEASDHHLGVPAHIADQRNQGGDFDLWN